MSKKITWNIIHKALKENFPSTYKRTVYWHPHVYATIEIYLEDGSKALYNFDFNEVIFLEERWKPEERGDE